MKRTVDAPRLISSSPMVGLIVNRIKILMQVKTKINDRPKAAAMIIHAPWSVSVTTANGGYCPSGTGNGKMAEDDMIPSVRDRDERS